MKKFSKIKFLNQIGFVNVKFDGLTFEHSRSSSTIFKSYVKALLKWVLIVTVPLKLFLSIFYASDDIRQLYIGSHLNFLSPKPKFFAGLAGKILEKFL